MNLKEQAEKVIRYGLPGCIGTVHLQQRRTACAELRSKASIDIGNKQIEQAEIVNGFARTHCLVTSSKAFAA